MKTKLICFITLNIFNIISCFKDLPTVNSILNEPVYLNGYIQKATDLVKKNFSAKDFTKEGLGCYKLAIQQRSLKYLFVLLYINRLNISKESSNSKIFSSIKEAISIMNKDIEKYNTKFYNFTINCFIDIKDLLNNFKDFSNNDKCISIFNKIGQKIAIKLNKLSGGKFDIDAENGDPFIQEKIKWEFLENIINCIPSDIYPDIGKGTLKKNDIEKVTDLLIFKIQVEFDAFYLYKLPWTEKILNELVVVNGFNMCASMILSRNKISGKYKFTEDAMYCYKLAIQKRTLKFLFLLLYFYSLNISNEITNSKMFSSIKETVSIIKSYIEKYNAAFDCFNNIKDSIIKFKDFSNIENCKGIFNKIVQNIAIKMYELSGIKIIVIGAENENFIQKKIDWVFFDDILCSLPIKYGYDDGCNITIEKCNIKKVTNLLIHKIQNEFH